MNSAYDPIEPASLELRPDGTLYSSRFEDVYSSAQGALDQARHVFLAGNGLPERWRRRKEFTIVETGFGAGLNFLATWQSFKASAPSDARLHYVSVEKHPFRREDLAKIYARHPELAQLTQPLFLQWPPLLPGFHRLHLEGGRVNLTLLFGDVVQMLAELDASADAFLLDGFAPSRNTQMWNAEVFRQVSRLAATGATCATYTVAAQVREGLAAVGFEVEKRPGFASKRDMLAGKFKGEGTTRARQTKRHALIIGAGLAGTSCGERLARRGWTVDLFEAHAATAQEASGNPAGLIRPVISADWNPHSRFTTSGFLYTMRHYAALAAAGHPIRQGAGGVVQVLRDDKKGEKVLAMLEHFRLPAEFVQYLTAGEVMQHCDVEVPGPALWFPEAAWAVPESMCSANLGAAGGSLRAHYNAAIDGIALREGEWHAFDSSGKTLGQAPVLVLANAHKALAFSPTRHLPLRLVRGQVTAIPRAPGNDLETAVCGDGYVTPPIDGLHWVGATFGERDPEPGERIEEHAVNLARARSLAPEFGRNLQMEGVQIKGRVAFRTMAKDRLPVVGPVGPKGLYACLALGSRGMTWSALAAETLASQISAEPLPLESDLMAGLDPRRFAAQP